MSLFVFALSDVPVSAQIPGGGIYSDPMMMFNSRRPDSNKPEKVVEQFQVQFIEQSFTRPMMETNATFFGEDEDEESFLGSSQDNEMLNSLMSHILAKELARRDAFGLKKPLLEQVDKLIESKR